MQLGPKGTGKPIGILGPGASGPAIFLVDERLRDCRGSADDEFGP
jgi:hypothetical protein